MTVIWSGVAQLQVEHWQCLLLVFLMLSLHYAQPRAVTVNCPSCSLLKPAPFRKTTQGVDACERCCIGSTGKATEQVELRELPSQCTSTTLPWKGHPLWGWEGRSVSLPSWYFALLSSKDLCQLWCEHLHTVSGGENSLHKVPETLLELHMN